MDRKYIHDISLDDLGFVNDRLETKYHNVSYFFQDIGMLMIESKEGKGFDSIHIEDYFEIDKFKKLITLITDYEFKIFASPLEKWVEVETDIDFKKFECYESDSSLHVTIDKYKIGDNTYRVSYGFGNYHNPFIEKLEK